MSDSLKANWRRDPWLMLAVGFGTGFVARMPGTVASVLAAALAWFLFCYIETLVQLGCVLLLMLISWYASHKVVRKYEVEDDPQIVVDEIAGTWVAVAILPEKLWIWLVAFILFRVFDIWKPFPIGWMDRKMTGALGILLDDVVAGLMALILANAVWIWIANP